MTPRQFSEIKRLARSEAGWSVLRDYLVLALDQAETGPQDAQGAAYMASLLRPALQIAHARMEAPRG